ncbi:MAG: DUF3500 domain-containing protein [Planctomycetes bacterium]|nr:DUF3500 domain-containing protein [Planctomycetota bacterium]
MQTPLAVGVMTLLAFSGGFALWSDGRASAPSALVAGDEASARAATTWLEALGPELRSKAQRPLADAERTVWNFVPGRYAGAELGTLDAHQRELALDVLRAMLSAEGLQKTLAIVALENVLKELETRAGQDASHRDPERYALLVLGEPSPAAPGGGTFAVRFQGHHVSLQVQVDGGKVVGHTPQFLGSNPHEQTSGAHRGERVLGAEEDLARALMLLFDEQALGKVQISATAPADVLLGPAKPPSALGDRRGLPWTEMNAVQQGVLWRLIEEYAHIWHGELADRALAGVRDQLDSVCFAWAGGRQRGQGHYYRIHGEHFAIEYDNTQNGANHVHTVWRDFDHDFGGELFERHLREQHGR